MISMTRSGLPLDAPGFFERYADRWMPEPNSGCWIWFGSQTTAGYGNLYCRDAYRYAHREAYEAANGRGSANGMVIRHRCDVPCCINPEHLLAGGYQENSDDMWARGRGNPPRGERSHRAVMTLAQALEIRSRASTEPISAIARSMNLSWWATRDVVECRTWAYLGPPIKDRPRLSRRPKC